MDIEIMEDEKHEKYNGLFFNPELMKKHGSAKACYEFIRQKELDLIIPLFHEWYDNYVECMGSAPNGTLGIFYAPFPQHPEKSEGYFDSWKKFIFTVLDKIILFFTLLRYFMLETDYGKEETYKKDIKKIFGHAYNTFDIYLRHMAEESKNQFNAQDECKNQFNAQDDLLQNIFDKEFKNNDINES